MSTKTPKHPKPAPRAKQKPAARRTAEAPVALRPHDAAAPAFTSAPRTRQDVPFKRDVEKKTGPQVRVVATHAGFYGGRRKAGDAFLVDAAAFSDAWMERVSDAKQPAPARRRRARR